MRGKEGCEKKRRRNLFRRLTTNPEQQPEREWSPYPKLGQSLRCFPDGSLLLQALQLWKFTQVALAYLPQKIHSFDPTVTRQWRQRFGHSDPD